MGTWVGKQKNLGDMLNSLLELNHDGCSAYTAALTRIDREDYRVRLRAMAGELRRHIDELKPYVGPLTTNASDSPSPKEIVTKGRVVLASLVGHDAAILGALHTTQQDIVAAYRNAVAFAGNTAQSRELLEAHLQVEVAHQKWLHAQISSPANPPATDETGATMKMSTIARTDAEGKTLRSSTDI